MALVDIVEEAIALLHSHQAVAAALGISVQKLNLLLQKRHPVALAPAVVIRAARLTKRNVCDALRTAGEAALATELESLLRDAQSPTQQAILDDLQRLPSPIRQRFIELIADRANTARKLT